MFERKVSSKMIRVQEDTKRSWVSLGIKLHDSFLIALVQLHTTYLRSDHGSVPGSVGCDYSIVLVTTAPQNTLLLSYNICQWPITH